MYVYSFSPDGKAKIQLQIVLHDGNSTTFHFVNPAGADLTNRLNNQSVHSCVVTLQAELALFAIYYLLPCSRPKNILNEFVIPGSF